MVEYIDDTHTYLVNGIIVPSVTQLLQYKFVDKYENVPKHILTNKADYGNKVHYLIELMNKTNVYQPIIDTVYEFDYVMASALSQYLKLKKKHKLEVLSQETIVYNDNIAGRFDMLAKVKKELSLIDIKTTAILDKEYVSWQLSIYNWLGKYNVKKLFALWLPKKELGELVEVELKTDKEIEKLIKEWRENNE